MGEGRQASRRPANLSDLGETLEKLLGPHRREAHFNLVEQVTQGATSE